jgi:quinol monooxygenase YgiN
VHYGDRVSSENTHHAATSLGSPALPDFMNVAEAPIMVVTRIDVNEPEDKEFLGTCMNILGNNPGCLGVELGRSLDSEVEHILVSRWSNVGLYRKALSSYQVKSEVIPFISVRTRDSFTAEIVTFTGIDGSNSFASGLAADAFTYQRGNQS